MYREHPTRTVITKDTIANDLFVKNKNTFLSALIGLIASLLIEGILLLILFPIDLNLSGGGVIGRLILLLPFLGLSVLYIVQILSTVNERKLIESRAFLVVTDQVIYKEEKNVRRRNTWITVKILHFSKFDDLKVGSTLYQITSEDDLFYMVVYEKNPTAVRKFYSSKMYEYKE